MTNKVSPTNPKSYPVSKDLGCVVSRPHDVTLPLCYPASRRRRHKKKEEEREI